MPCTPDGATGPFTTVNPNLPADASGNLPFLKRLDGANWTSFLGTYANVATESPDLTTPNPAYWASMDGALNAIAARGLLALTFPLYCGFTATHQGWMQEMEANGSTNCATYGAFITARYFAQKNLVWLIGGDRGTGASSVFTAPQLAVETAFVNALLGGSVQNPAVMVSAEWSRGSIGPDQATLGSNITLSGFYGSATDINNQAQRSYASSPALPSFLIEGVYDDETDSGTRRLQWWALLSGVGGYCVGNDYVYPFDAAQTWKSHLGVTGTLDLQRLNAFARTIAWYALVPSFPSDGSPLITAGGSTISAADYVASSAAPDGSLLLAYIPPAHAGTITVKMSGLRGLARSRWFDPTAGTYTADATGLSNSGTHIFTPPGTNVGGQTDWLLVVDA